MRQSNGLRPQDIVVLLKLLASSGREWRQVDLARELGLSQYEISVSLTRSEYSGFLDGTKKRLNKSALKEFVLHGLKYVYPVKPGPVCRGVPTSHSTPPLSNRIVSNEDDQYVWPYGDGSVRGQAIEPLYHSVPAAAVKDPELHQLLALVDALRVGRARERELGAEELTRRLQPA